MPDLGACLSWSAGQFSEAGQCSGWIIGRDVVLPPTPLIKPNAISPS